MTAPEAGACSGYDYRSSWPCGRPPKITVIAACEHEHIGPRDLCDWHLGDLRAGMMLCGNCRDCSQPHKCVLRPVPVPAGSAR